MNSWRCFHVICFNRLCELKGTTDTVRLRCYFAKLLTRKSSSIFLEQFASRLFNIEKEPMLQMWSFIVGTVRVDCVLLVYFYLFPLGVLLFTLLLYFCMSVIKYSKYYVFIQMWSHFVKYLLNRKITTSI